MSGPILAVSALIRRGDVVLLVRRAHAPAKDLWAFPGGKVQPGERLEDAATREVREETGITVSGVRRIDVVEVIDRDPDGTLRSHYVLVVFAATAAAGEVRAGDDAAEVRWVDPAGARRLPLTAETARLLAGGATLRSR